MTCIRVGAEHLAGDLGVTRFVGADQSELVPAEDRNESVEQDEEGYDEEDDELPRRLGPDAFELSMQPDGDCMVLPCAGCDS